MKFPSLQSLWSGLKNVSQRFPLEILVTVIAVICAIKLVNSQTPQYFSSNKVLIRILIASHLGLLVFLSFTLFSESRSILQKQKYAVRIIALGLVVFIGFMLNPNDNKQDLLRYIFLTFSFHLLVSFAPFIGRGSLDGFWEFNKALFLRFLTSALYSAALFAGLAIALASINGLFNAHIPSERYFQLWILIAGLFNTIFFLAGIPSDLKIPENADNYPKGLKIFTQYVLIPLATVYLAILLAYEIKILINWELPKGYVSMLIMGYAVFGILSLLLVYPIRNNEDNRWIKVFSKSFYLLMIPLLVLLLFAVWKRASEYGITESRYVLILLSIWLIGITLYFLVSKKDNIKVIPISLFFLSVMAVYGPQSAGAVSEYSQISRLRFMLAHKSKEKESQIASTIDYLVNQHGLESLQPVVKEDINKIKSYYLIKIKKDTLNRSAYYENYDVINNTKDSILRSLKVDRSATDGVYTPEVEGFFELSQDAIIDVSGYKRAVQFEANEMTARIKGYNDNDIKSIECQIGNKTYEIFIDSLHRVSITNESKTISFDTKVVLNTLLSKKTQFKQNSSGYRLDVPGSLMVFNKTLNGTLVTCRFNKINGTKNMYPSDFTGIILIK